MAEQKKHSGFEAPVYGTVIPKGTRWKKNPDGTSTPIYPKKKDEKSEDKKKTAKK